MSEMIKLDDFRPHVSIDVICLKCKIGTAPSVLADHEGPVTCPLCGSSHCYTLDELFERSDDILKTHKARDLINAIRYMVRIQNNTPHASQ